ncbi:hypothetical protein EV360DRAFT_71239 [Lentinula raphanica]|nr:hypothetical protein EV360DRAFT_71239 [Lentinula raphanica]
MYSKTIYHSNGQLGTADDRELERAIATMEKVPGNFRNDDDDDFSLDSGSIKDAAIELKITEPTLIGHHSERMESQTPYEYEDNPSFAPPSDPPSVDLYPTAAMVNPMDLLLDYGSDDDNTASSPPSCPPIDSSYLSADVTATKHLEDLLNLIDAPPVDSIDSMDVVLPDTTPIADDVFGKLTFFSGFARHSRTTLNGTVESTFGGAKGVALIEQHTIDGSEERVQWTKHVDELGEALRENDTLPNAPTYYLEPFGQSEPVSQRSAVFQQDARKKRKVPERVMQLLDIEAEDDEDGDDSEGEEDNKDSFIDDDTTVPSSTVPPISVTPLVQTLNAAFLEHLEDTYVHHASTAVATEYDSPKVSDSSVDDLLNLNSRDRHWVERIFPEVDHECDDWSLFGLKCKVGSEYGLLYDIIHTPALLSEVRSAFINPSIGNYLYVEARFPEYHSKFLSFLSNRSDVQLNTMKTIALEDHKSCLWVRPRQKSIFSEGTWVQINAPGPYRGDVGLVRGLRATPARLCICLLLVPRLHRFGDADQSDNETRPPLELVLDTTLESAMSEHPAIEKHTPENDAPYFLWANWTFQSGLLVEYFAPASLSVANTISTTNKDLLLKSQHPMVLARRNSLPVPETWKFEEGEAVSVLDAATDLLASHGDGVIRTVVSQSCEVEIQLDNGIKQVEVIPMECLVKKHTPGDYVRVLGGPHAHTTGMVGERNGRVLGLILDNSHSVSLWVDINSVAAETSKTSLALTNTPWKDIEVIVTKFELGSLVKGNIKRAWPDGHGSVRLLVYVPSSHCSVELDYTEVVQSQTMRTLENLVLDTNRSQTFFDYFRIDRTLHRMKTGPEPWIGVRVLVVQGNWHGITGTVQEVNKYPLDLQKKPRASGISLLVELNLATTNVVNPKVKLDYDDVREYRASKSAGSRFDTPPRPRTPLYDPDSVRSMYEFIGAWYPGSSVERPSSFASSIYPNAPETHHFLFHKQLLGLPIRVDIDGGAYDTLRTKAGERYVIPTPCEDGSILLKIDQTRVKVGEMFVHSSAVLRHRDRPKPSTEKRLMVVVGGNEEHIGKLVRRLYYFFKGSKSDENKCFILAVVNFSGGNEIVTEERIELHPDNLEYVRESKENVFVIRCSIGWKNKMPREPITKSYNLPEQPQPRLFARSHRLRPDPTGWSRQSRKDDEDIPNSSPSPSSPSPSSRSFTSSPHIPLTNGAELVRTVYRKTIPLSRRLKKMTPPAQLTSGAEESASPTGSGTREQPHPRIFGRPHRLKPDPTVGWSPEDDEDTKLASSPAPSSPIPGSHRTPPVKNGGSSIRTVHAKTSSLSQKLRKIATPVRSMTHESASPTTFARLAPYYPPPSVKITTPVRSITSESAPPTNSAHLGFPDLYVAKSPCYLPPTVDASHIPWPHEIKLMSSQDHAKLNEIENDVLPLARFRIPFSTQRLVSRMEAQMEALARISRENTPLANNEVVEWDGPTDPSRKWDELKAYLRRADPEGLHCLQQQFVMRLREITDYATWPVTIELFEKIFPGDLSEDDLLSTATYDAQEETEQYWKHVSESKVVLTGQKAEDETDNYWNILAKRSLAKA